MNAVVTIFGGSGFVGKHVVRALAREGWRIKVAVRHLDAAYDLRPLGDVGQIQIIRCDITRESQVEAALKGSDAVVNLVGIGYQTLGRSFSGTHVKAAAFIAKTAKALGVRRMVQMSALGASERSPSAYGRTKAAGEAAVKAHLPEAVILRPSVIFGPGDGFFNLLAVQAKTLPFLPSIDGGKTRFQPAYVGDVARAVVLGLTSEAAKGKTFELGGPQTYSFDDLRRYVGSTINARKPLVFLPLLAARLIAFGGDLMALLTPLTPVLTTDQLLMLKADNVVAKGASGFKDLGMAPEAMEAIVPTYLWRYRTGGQFAKA